MSPDVRPATQEDWQAWRDVRLRALRADPEAFCSTYEREAAFTVADWKQRLAEPAYLGWQDGTPVALGGGYTDTPQTLQVVAMWTAPEGRGLGLGRRILSSVVDWGRAAQLDVRLQVTVGNDTARRLYESFGFVGTGETEPIRPGSPLRVEWMVLPGPSGPMPHPPH